MGAGPGVHSGGAKVGRICARSTMWGRGLEYNCEVRLVPPHCTLVECTRTRLATPGPMQMLRHSEQLQRASRSSNNAIVHRPNRQKLRIE